MTPFWRAVSAMVTLAVATAALRAQPGPEPPPGGAAPRQAQAEGVPLPPGEGRDVLVKACNRCHIVTTVLGRQRDRAEWTAVVDRMRTLGAPASDDDAAVIVGYLAAHFSPGSKTPLPDAARGGRLFLLGGRVPDLEPVVGQPVETRDPIGAGQKPAFPGQTRAPYVRTVSEVTAIVATTGLRHPWSLAFLPDGRMLVTEKPGAMRIVTRAGRIGPDIAGVPPVHFGIDAGLLDVVLDPAFASNRLIYFTYVEPREGGIGTTLARARLNQEGTALEDVTVLLRIEPTRPGGIHFGSRLLFDAQGKLLMTMGERADPATRPLAQRLDSRLGKVLRLNPDGTAAPDNPFVDTAGALPDVWAYGLRNSQGLALHPVTREIWFVDHGEAGGDEVNIARPGRNYGWPVIAYGTEYDLRPIGRGQTAAPGMEQPVYYWDPAIGPTSLAFYSGRLIPEWQNNLFVASHNGQHLARLVLDGERVVGEERLLLDQRQLMRWVGQGPDGALWVLTDDKDGRLIRLAPSGL